VRVCHCHGVSDREIISLVREGVDDVAAVGDFCGAGTRCGGCRPAVEHLVRRSVQEHADRLAVLAVAQGQGTAVAVASSRTQAMAGAVDPGAMPSA
jgi:bacterioferritin-associated ferredoxin